LRIIHATHTHPQPPPSPVHIRAQGTCTSSLSKQRKAAAGSIEQKQPSTTHTRINPQQPSTFKHSFPGRCTAARAAQPCPSEGPVLNVRLPALVRLSWAVHQSFCVHDLHVHEHWCAHAPPTSLHLMVHASPTSLHLAASLCCQCVHPRMRPGTQACTTTSAGRSRCSDASGKHARGGKNQLRVRQHSFISTHTR